MLHLDFILQLQQIANPILDGLLTFVNLFSQQTVLVLIVSFIYWTIDKKKGEQLAFSLMFTITLTCGIKGVFKAPRPYRFPGIQARNIDTAPGYSFPSADSSAASSVAFTLGSWVRKRKWLVWSGLTLYALSIGFCRMYFGLHFLIDVSAGLLLGLVCAAVIAMVFRSVKNTWLLFLGAAAVLSIFPLFSAPEVDYYKTLGLLWGFASGIWVEHRYVNFTTNISRLRKAARFLLGVGIILFLYTGLHFLFPEGHLFEFLQKFLLTFFAVGLYPILFHRLKL